MENNEILQLWKSYEDKLSTSLSLNQKLGAEIAGIKAGSALQSMRPAKYFALLVGGIWVLAGTSLVGNLIVYAYQAVSIYFLVSASLQLLFTTIALVLYVQQLYLLGQVDFNAPVVETQLAIAKLRKSSLWVGKILLLQLPTWTTFFWSKSLFEHGNTWLLLMNMFVTAAAVAISIWFFVNIDMKNKDKKWFRLLFSGKEWSPLDQAASILEGVAEFEGEGASKA